MTSKDFKVLVGILLIGATIFGGMLAWAEKANHVTDTDSRFGVTMRNAAMLNK